MADWSALTKGFQQGANWRQDYRANKQLERAREQALETGEFDLEGMRRTSKVAPPGELGEGYKAPDDWSATLRDPFGERLWGKFKGWMQQRRAARSAIPTASPADPASAPVATVEPVDELPMSDVQTFPVPDYADGGGVESPNWGKMTEAEKARYLAERNRTRAPGSVQNVTETVRGADRTAAPPRRAIDLSKADDAVGKFTGRAAEGAGKLGKLKAGAKQLGAAGALAGTALETAGTDTEDYRKRFGMETDDPSLGGDILARGLGAASDLGNLLTFGAAGRLYRDKQERPAPATSAPPQEALPVSSAAPDSGWVSGSSSASTTTAAPRSALPQAPQEDQTIDFSQVDIDARDVPNMTLDDWKRYRREMVQAAQASGRGESVDKMDQMVTGMQQRGFLNYAKQGFALQQAGNVRGAMAAYRAAYQYFPIGFDVEFGTVKGRDGRMNIVGVGVDEKSGKVVPGTQMLMDPERVSTLIENFTNPNAFRMWTKDWREFQQGQREYTEIKKPLAQAQATYFDAQAADRYAEAANGGSGSGGPGGGLTGADRRAAEKTFRDRLGMMGMQDEAQADYLASVMSMLKMRSPQTPDNTIVQIVMQAVRDGTLEQRLQKLTGTPPRSAAPDGPVRQAIPGDPNDGRPPIILPNDINPPATPGSAREQYFEERPNLSGVS